MVRLAMSAGGTSLVAALAAISLPGYIVLAVPIAIGGMIFLMNTPIVALAAVVFFSQADALTTVLFQSMPISAVKLLTLVTILGLLVNRVDLPVGQYFRYDTPITGLVLLFVGALILSALFAGNHLRALDELRRMLSVLVLFYLIFRLAQSQQRIDFLIYALLGGTVISSVVVVYDWSFGKNLLQTAVDVTSSTRGSLVRSAGASNTDPTTAASLILAGTTMALIYCLRSARWRLLTGSVFVIGSVAMVLTFARSAVLTFCLMLIIFLFKLRSHRRFPLIIMVGLIVAVIGIALVPGDYWNRLAALTNFDADRSLLRRFSYQIIGLDLISQHPLLGVGPGNFPIHFLDFEYRWIPGRTLVARELHNLYFQVTVETGILGLACFLGIFGVALNELNDTRKHGSSVDIRTTAEAIQFSFISLLIVSTFLPNWGNKYLWIYIGLAAATHAVDRRTRHKEGGERAISGRPYRRMKVWHGT